MKKITFFIVLFCSVLIVSAQEKDGFSTDLGRKTTFERNGFWDNWFIGAGAGANMYFGDKDVNASFFDRLTVAPNIQFGKWINPYLGGRIKASGITNIHTFNDDANIMSRNKYITVEANFMWNVTDYLMNYNADRWYAFIPYVGFGWAYGWDYSNFPENINPSNHVNSATVDAGIINKFRLSERVSLNIEFSSKLLNDNFDQRTGGKHNYDLLGTASASLIYNIGSKATFREAVLRDQAEIDVLNNKINAQRDEIEKLINRPIPEPQIVEVVKKEVVNVNKGNEPVNNVVLFKINQTKIDPMQQVNVYNVAMYLKDNTDMKVRIVGYTDKATGTATVNEKLSRERAQNVADMLTGKYGIDKDRVFVDWEGQSNPPFGVPEWDRAVIMYLEEIDTTQK